MKWLPWSELLITRQMLRKTSRSATISLKNKQKLLLPCNCTVWPIRISWHWKKSMPVSKSKSRPWQPSLGMNGPCLTSWRRNCVKSRNSLAIRVVVSCKTLLKRLRSIQPVWSLKRKPSSAWPVRVTLNGPLLVLSMRRQWKKSVSGTTMNWFS